MTKRGCDICWFLDDARAIVTHAFVASALLQECGVPVAKVATHRPGMILYRDPYQIVAKPIEATPTRWHWTLRRRRRAAAGPLVISIVSPDFAGFRSHQATNVCG
jgi:hypothetical protein